jgi:prevent-host-death family protein
MTTISVEELRANLDRYLATAATEDIVVTRDGKPFVVLQAVPENGDADAALLGKSEAFWEMVRQRRQEPGIPWNEARKQLELAD